MINKVGYWSMRAPSSAQVSAAVGRSGDLHHIGILPLKDGLARV
jgi:hypothetical protein